MAISSKRLPRLSARCVTDGMGLFLLEGVSRFTIRHRSSLVKARQAFGKRPHERLGIIMKREVATTGYGYDTCSRSSQLPRRSSVPKVIRHDEKGGHRESKILGHERPLVSNERVTHAVVIYSAR